MNENFIDHITIDGTTKYIQEHRAPWELIREGTFTKATEEDFIITIGADDKTFQLTDLILMFETPVQETYAAKGAYGQITFYYGTELSITTECGSWTQEANGQAHAISTWIKNDDGMIIAMGGGVTTSSNNWGMRLRYLNNFGSSTAFFYYPGFAVNKIVIKAVTGKGHYKLYGRRKETFNEGA